MKTMILSVLALFGTTALAAEGRAVLFNNCSTPIQYQFKSDSGCSEKSQPLFAGQRFITNLVTGRTGNVYEFDNDGTFTLPATFAWNIDNDNYLYSVSQGAPRQPFAIKAEDAYPEQGAPEEQCPAVECADGPDCEVTKTCSVERSIVITLCGGPR